MKSDISLAYRSLSRPDPLWPEQAIYGGYKYIQLNEGIWIHRTHEAYVNILMSDETTDAMRLRLKYQTLVQFLLHHNCSKIML